MRPLLRASERNDRPSDADLKRTQNQELHEPPRCRSTLPPSHQARTAPAARVLQGSCNLPEAGSHTGNTSERTPPGGDV